MGEKEVKNWLCSSVCIRNQTKRIPAEKAAATKSKASNQIFFFQRGGRDLQKEVHKEKASFSPDQKKQSTALSFFLKQEIVLSTVWVWMHVPTQQRHNYIFRNSLKGKGAGV